MERTASKPPPAAGPNTGSLDQMAEEIFSLTVMAWRQRVAAKQPSSEELSESQYLALDTIVRASAPTANAESPPALTVGQIQRAIGVLPAQMSRIIRSLETAFEKPLIRCELNQSDKRKINVAMTPDGRRIYNEFRSSRLSKTLDILRQLTDKDRLEFVRICRRIRELYEKPHP